VLAEMGFDKQLTTYAGAGTWETTARQSGHVLRALLATNHVQRHCRASA
jgi:hypothetical protein